MARDRLSALEQGDANFLTPEEEQLLVLRDFLYQNGWGEMKADLCMRKKSKLFIRKLYNRIDEDLNRISIFESLESKGIFYAYDPETMECRCYKVPRNP